MVTLTEKKRRKIYSLIEKEGIQDCAKKFNVTEGYVRMVIRGERNNLDILEFVIKLASEKSDKLDSKINSIKSSLKKI